MAGSNFTVTPLSGNTYSTKFEITNLPDGNFIKYVWDFGDKNLIYDEKFPSRIYKTAGIQTITLSATNNLGVRYTYTQTVSTEFPYRDYVKFVNVPYDFANPGLPTKTPFKLEVLSSQIDKPLHVDLYAANTRSIPWQFVYKRWEFLNPTWKFLDKNFNKIETLIIPSIPVYKDGVIVALSGTEEFYFVDSLSNEDLSENKPILITATLQTSGFVNPNDSYIYDYASYSNNETVRAGLLWHVNDLSPRLLKVTSNYLDNFQKEIWATKKTPFIITCHGNKALQVQGATNEISEILFSYPKNNTIGNIQPIDINLTGTTKSNFSIGNFDTYTDLYFQARDSKNYRLGGFIFETFTPSVCSITDQTTLQVYATAYNMFSSERDNKFIYPIGSAPNIAAWISNPSHNVLNKIVSLPYKDNCPTINYFKEKKALVDGYINTIDVPSLTGIESFNYSYTEGSDVYSIVIDPRDNSAIVGDAQQDKLFKFSTTGELLSVFSFFNIDSRNALTTTNWNITSLETILETTSSLDLGFTTTTWSASSLQLFKTYPYTNPVGVPSPEITDIFIVNEQKRVFILDKTSKEVYSYEMLIPDNFENLRYLGRYSFFTFDNQPTKIHFSNDGLRMFVLGQQNAQIYQFRLTTPWDITTGVIQTGQRSWNVPSQFTATCFTFNEDGTALFLGGVDTFGGIRVYRLTQPWNIASADNAIKILNTPTLTNISDIKLTPQNVDQKLFAYDKTLNRLVEFNFTGYLKYDSLFQTTRYYEFTNTLKNKINGFTIYTPVFTALVYTNENLIYEYAFDRIIHGTLNTPSCLTLDRDCNLWVSLFNSVSVVKIDNNFNYLFSVAPSSTNYLQTYDGDYLFKPPIVETDKYNNCWTTYAHPLCSFLVKYDPYGNIVKQINLDLYAVPNGLAITPQNNIWVLNSYNVNKNRGSFELYNGTTYQKLSTIPIKFRPSFFALDRDSHIWFTYGTRRFGTINIDTGSITSWQLSYDDNDDPFNTPTFITTEEERTDEFFGGLTVDVFNRVWLIDTYNSNVWVLSASPNFKQQNFKKIKILPSTPKSYYLTIPNNITYTEEVNQFTVQAGGDWTGNKWYQKYCDQTTLSSFPLSGSSTPFAIKPFKNNYQFVKHNEDFNMAGYLQSLALEENFANNQQFFKTFLGAVVGDSSQNTYQDIGQTIYKKIANFTDNHADIDTCDIDQLVSYAQLTNVPYIQYNLNLPTELKETLNAASIPRNKLCGLPDNIPLLLQSIGPELNYLTATVSAGTKMVLRSKLTGQYTITNLPVVQGQYVYPLSSFNSSVFEQPISKRYYFYQFNPKYNGTYIENLIDWSSSNTVLSPTLSTYQDWYNIEGIIENNFKYVLTKNLFTK
jgi:hypothetical protein